MGTDQEEGTGKARTATKHETTGGTKHGKDGSIRQESNRRGMRKKGSSVSVCLPSFNTQRGPASKAVGRQSKGSNL